MVSAEFATAVLSGLGWYVHVRTYFFPRRSFVRKCWLEREAVGELLARVGDRLHVDDRHR
jgi:hypothetical protein